MSNRRSAIYAVINDETEPDIGEDTPHHRDKEHAQVLDSLVFALSSEKIKEKSIESRAQIGFK
jgi:hypothetical protein